MKYLVECSCGHTLERHGAGGCRGEAGFACACRRDQEGALETAIDAVRSDAFFGSLVGREAQTVSEPST